MTVWPDQAGAAAPTRTLPAPLLLLVVDASPDAVLVMHGDLLELAYASEGTARLIGYAPHELVGMTPDQLFAISDLAALRERARTMGDTDRVTVQRPLRRADGAWVDCEVRLRSLRDGTDRWVAAFCRRAGDARDRRRADDAHRVEQARGADDARRADDARGADDAGEAHELDRWPEVDAERQRIDQEFILVAEQERIARDLHDTVIQALFGIGLSLQAAAAETNDDRTRHRVNRAVDDLDGAIRSLRTTVFSLHQSPPVSSGLRDQVTSIAHDIGRSLGFAPVVEFIGPVDLAVADEVHRQLLPCLRESLSNVARHAGAGHVEICLRVEEEVVLQVSDDGRGIPAGARRGHGQRNLERRAQLLGGQCRFLPRDGGGTVVEWRVPADTTGTGKSG